MVESDSAVAALPPLYFIHTRWMREADARWGLSAIQIKKLKLKTQQWTLLIWSCAAVTVRNLQNLLSLSLNKDENLHH